MKTLAMAVAAALATIAPLANAQWDSNRSWDNDRQPYAAPERHDMLYDRRGERARVLESRPIYAQGGTHEECWNEETHSDDRTRVGVGTALGAIAGGVIGHQIGNGRGNDVATAAGAIGGGVIGNRVARNHSGESNVERRCRTVSDDSGSSNDIVGYDVRYEYRGRQFDTRMDHDPGRWLEVGRDTRPDGDPLDAANPYPERPSYDRDRR